MVASASRLILSTSLRWSVNFNSWYSGFNSAFERPEFLRSRCSHVICWDDFVSRLGNIKNSSHSGPCQRRLQFNVLGLGLGTRARELCGNSRNRFPQLAMSVDGLSERD